MVCLCFWKAEVLLFEIIGQCSDVMKSKMAEHGKFESRNLLRCLVKFVTKALFLEQLSINSRQQPRFPLNNEQSLN